MKSHFCTQTALIFRWCILWPLLATLIAVGLLPNAAAKEPYTIDDYFDLKRVVELALSATGEMVAYAVEFSSLEENKTVQEVYVSKTLPGAKPISMAAIHDARNLSWIPGTHELAFLSDRNGQTQIYSINFESNGIQQHTYSRGSVMSFKFSPNGQAVAWLTRNDLDFDQSSEHPNYERSGLYERLLKSLNGVKIDLENVSLYDFVNPGWGNYTIRTPNKLWLKLASREPFSLNVPGQVKSFYWSSDGSKLSVTYAANSLPQKAVFSKYTSIGFIDIETRTFESIMSARWPTGTETAVYFDGGEWVPDSSKLFVQRSVELDSWTRNQSWALVEISEPRSQGDAITGWNEMEFFVRDPEPAFIPVDENTIYSNKTVNAVQNVFLVSQSGLIKADIADHVDGGITQFQYSRDFQTAAFVNASLENPPEVFVWRKGQGSKRLSDLNRKLANKLLPKVRELKWKSEDGIEVQGWLIEPSRTDHHGPSPLLTFVHGGPGAPVINNFSFHLSNVAWPHPYEVYALEGIAVFIPNYRGTKTFGVEYSDPKNLDGEPIEDIISGIRYLIREGIADPDRLAISGYSHGAWLGPLTLTKAKSLYGISFQAASFAEGTLNKVVQYSTMPAWLNRVTHDVQNGGSLYDHPERYIDLSPDLHFEEVDTPILFEAGARGLAINMLGSAKLAHLLGMPVDYVVYPRTAHQLLIPRLQKESAERNLDWFRFWLLGKEDWASAKSEQFNHWRGLRQTPKQSN